MKQKQQRKLQEEDAFLSGKKQDFRDEIANWLKKYPWTHMWTPTFKRKEEEGGSANFSRARSCSVSGEWSGGGTFKPDWSFREQSDLHCSGFTERAATRATKSFIKKYMPEYSYFFVNEKNPGRDGHHVHALLIPPGQLDGRSHIPVSSLAPIWWQKYGWNRFERIKSPDAITSYCTKHVCEYLNKGVGWYEIEINDTEVFHAANA